MSAALQRHPNGAAVFLGAFARACKPRKSVTVSQWADEHRIMSSKASGKKGPWRTSLVPMTREPMDCLSERSTVEEVTLMKPAQSSGTEIGLNWIGYVMEHAPAPMLYVQPNVSPAAERFVIQRLNPLLVDTPVLAELFDAKRSRSGSNSKFIKDYPGGILIIGGANSPASLASMPIKYVIEDEKDRFPWEVGKEGDPDGLIVQRQATFSGRKKLNISTPTMAGSSRIEDDYERSDKRRYYMPCPHCASEILFEWGNLQWRLDMATKEVLEVWYVCKECGGVIEEHHKPEMLAKGRWVAEKPERSHRHRGYTWNALYAPLGLGFRWIELVRQWLDAQGDNSKLKRFINTVFAETWEDRTRDVRPNVLMDRAEPFKLRQVPPGCLLLTAAVDVQDDRLECGIVGWGRGEAIWFLDYHVIPGDPGQLLEQARRGEGALVEYLNTPLRNTFGKDMPIQATAIDTGGHYTHEVYAFVRARRVRRPMAIKGANKPNRAVLVARPTPVDVNHRGKTIKGGVMLWTVGTDTAKSLLFNKFASDNGVEPANRKVHFSEDLPPEFYDQLTAEAFDPEKNKWVKRRNRRNEALDLFVYNAAAAQHPEIRVHAMRKGDWDRLERILEPEGGQEQEDGESVPEPSAPAPEDPPTQPARKKTRRRRGGGFVTGWKR